ncbi:MAG: hypothetical protein M5U08_12760 [Burkholderiales bacterium]|nr:hypothetical protein [Burkholderiales bacterium]
MEISKSSRHSKITGDFAERLVLYWLSKYGFECAYVDHVGVDIIARNPHADEIMGISVKSRSRNPGTEGTYVSIPNDNLTKLDAACKAFDCKPYFAVVVDEAEAISVYILSKAHLLALHPAGNRVISWKMGDKWTAKLTFRTSADAFGANFLRRRRSAGDQALTR